MIGMLGRDCPVWVTGDYRKPLSNLIVAHKDRGAWGLVNHLAALQAQAIRATRPPSSAVVVPVPSAVRAVRVRGYDHGWEIARRAARAVGLSARRELVRTREVVDQAALSRAGRLLAQDHSMAVRPGWFAPVIITDDVITTGATIREALRAYQAGGRKVAAIVAICRTVRRK